MQKKHFLLVVISLALLTVVAVGFKQNSPYGLMVGMDRFGETLMEESVSDSAFPVPMMEDVGGAAGEMAVTSKMMVGAEPAIGIMPPYYGDDALDVVERSYEKSSYHSVVVDDVAMYMRGVKEYFASIDGIILNSSINSGDKYESASLYAKVPVEKFDEATGRITEEVEKVVDESISAYDITGQVVNTEENVTYLQEQKALTEARLKDAQTEVEKTRIQIEIDRLDRQIKSAQQAQENVTSRTEYASVSVTAASSERYYNPGSRGDFGYEFERAWESLKYFSKMLIVVGIWVAVYAVVWAPVVWVGSKVLKKIKK